MNHHIVAYGDIVADYDGRFLIESVEHTTVLDVHTVADGDGVDIAAQHSVEPHAALVAHSYITNNGGILGEEAVFAYFRLKAANIDNKCHYLTIFLVLVLSHSTSSGVRNGEIELNTRSW